MPSHVDALTIGRLIAPHRTVGDRPEVAVDREHARARSAPAQRNRLCRPGRSSAVPVLPPVSRLGGSVYRRLRFGGGAATVLPDSARQRGRRPQIFGVDRRILRDPRIPSQPARWVLPSSKEEQIIPILRARDSASPSPWRCRRRPSSPGPSASDTDTPCPSRSTWSDRR